MSLLERMMDSSWKLIGINTGRSSRNNKIYDELYNSFYSKEGQEWVTSLKLQHPLWLIIQKIPQNWKRNFHILNLDYDEDHDILKWEMMRVNDLVNCEEIICMISFQKQPDKDEWNHHCLVTAASLFLLSKVNSEFAENVLYFLKDDQDKIEVSNIADERLLKFINPKENNEKNINGILMSAINFNENKRLHYPENLKMFNSIREELLKEEKEKGDNKEVEKTQDNLKELSLVQNDETMVAASPSESMVLTNNIEPLQDEVKEERKVEAVEQVQPSTEIPIVYHTREFLSDHLNWYMTKKLNLKEDFLYLPIPMIAQWIHPEFGPCQAIIQVLFIDENKRDYPQPKQDERDKEYFRFPYVPDSYPKQNDLTRVGVRICIFHVIVEVFPRLCPLSTLVGQFFSSPHSSAKALGIPYPAYDAYALIGHHYPIEQNHANPIHEVTNKKKGEPLFTMNNTLTNTTDEKIWSKERITLKTIMQWKCRFINHSFFSDDPQHMIKFTGHSIESISPRDMLAGLCRQECNIYSCTQKDSYLLQVLSTKCKHRRTIQDSYETLGLRMSASKPTLDEDPDHNQNLLKNSNGDYVLPKSVEKKLDSPLAKLMTFDGLSAYQVEFKSELPFWYSTFLKRLNKLMQDRHESLYPASENYEFEYQFEPLVPIDFIQTDQDLEKWQKYYSFEAHANDFSIKGISIYSSANLNQCYFLTRWLAKEWRYQYITQPYTYDYGMCIYVPLLVNFIESRPFIFFDSTRQEVKHWNSKEMEDQYTQYFTLRKENREKLKLWEDTAKEFQQYMKKIPRKRKDEIADNNNLLMSNELDCQRLRAKMQPAEYKLWKSFSERQDLRAMKIYGKNDLRDTRERR